MVGSSRTEKLLGAHGSELESSTWQARAPRQQIPPDQQGYGFCWKNMCPKTFQLFQENVLEMFHELKAAGVQFAGVRSIEEDVFDHMAQVQPFT